MRLVTTPVASKLTGLSTEKLREWTSRRALVPADVRPLPMKRHPHRGIIVAGHPTSLRLEAEFWDFLREIAYERQLSLSELINTISQAKSRKVTLASALRVFVAQHYRAAASQRC